MRRIFKEIVPKELLGGIRNINIFHGFLMKFLMLGRYEKMDVKHIASRMKVSQLPWITQDHVKGQQAIKNKKLVITLLQWIFDKFIASILSGYFYITETSWSTNKVFFYRKKVWYHICEIGLQPLIGKMYQPITQMEVQQKLKLKQSIGVHLLRLIPGKEKVICILLSYSPPPPPPHACQHTHHTHTGTVAHMRTCVHAQNSPRAHSQTQTPPPPPSHTNIPHTHSLTLTNTPTHTHIHTRAHTMHRDMQAHTHRYTHTICYSPLLCFNVSMRGGGGGQGTNCRNTTTLGALGWAGLSSFHLVLGY